MASFSAVALASFSSVVDIAATLRNSWPDVAITIYALLAVVLPLAALPRLAQRAVAPTRESAE